MATLGEMLKRVALLDLRNNVKNIIISLSPEMIDLNTGQLEIGKLSYGTQIEPMLMNDEYARQKKAMGGKADFGVPDLKNEGDFYSGFMVTINGSEYDISSSDSKTNHLIGKYGGEIFGLSKESKTVFANEILIYEIRNYITKATGLTF